MIYIIHITENGPLSFRSGRETTSASTLTYIPGNILLGALASTYIKLRDNPAEFNEIFFSDSSTFSNIYPASFKHEDLQGDLDPIYPLPNSASTCKRFPGFRFDEDEDYPENPHHGMYDTLIPWALFTLSDNSRADVLDSIKECPICAEALDRIDGFYRVADEEAMGKVSINPGLRTRTGINRATGTVQQGILYSREILRPNTSFWGTVTVPDAQADTLKEFVKEANKSGLLRVGNNRTRGFGRIRLEVIEEQPVDDIASLRERIESFDTELREQAQAHQISSPDKLYLPLTLTSDAILFDHLLRYRTAIDGQYLKELGIPGAKLIYQNSGTRQVMGWNTLLRVPKADEIAITMGSVFLFGLDNELDDNLLQTLLRMQTEGIGARRSEGFGQLLVASHFHWEVKGT